LDGKWHHVAFTFTAADNSVRLYVDYVLSSLGYAGSALVYDASELRIGEGAGGQAFDGWIDEVRISDQVLQPDQFMTLTAPTSTVGYWTFDDGAAPALPATLTNTFYAPILYGTAEAVGNGAKPTFSSERPPATTPRISDGKKGPVVNVNSGSLFFVDTDVTNAPWMGGGQVKVLGTSVPTQLTNFTAEAFVKVNRHYENWPQIIGKARNLTGGLSWSLAINSAGNLRARFDSQVPPDTWGQNDCFESSANMLDGQWHHVAITYDYPAQHVTLYKDYVKVLEGTTVHPMVCDGGDIKIGAGDQPFDGWIDEVRLTSRVLTPTEFLYAVPVAGTLISVH